MTDGNQNRPQRKRNHFDELRSRLVGNLQEGAQRPATLQFGIHRNQVTLTVRSNHPNDTKNYGRIQATLDMPTFGVLTDLMAKAPSWNNDTKEIIECWDQPFINGQRSKDLKLDTKVVVGKDREGVVYLAVLSWDSSRPIVKFPIRPSQYTRLTHGDGSSYTEAEATLLYAPGWAKQLTQIISTLLADDFYERPDNNNGRGGYGGGQGGGNQGGYGNRQQGGGNNYNQRAGGGGGQASGGQGGFSSSDFSDDLPGL